VATSTRRIASHTERLACFQKIEEEFARLGPGAIRNAHIETISILENGNVIKKFTSKTLQEKWDHIFSVNHKEDGIKLLADTESEIVNIFTEYIIQADQENILKIGSNQINAIINGNESVIRFFIDREGEIKSINGFRIKDTSVQLRSLGHTINMPQGK